MPTKLILDSCLSILLTVGLTAREYISKHKRLQGYDLVDFENVLALIERSDGIIFIPNVLTETSNLIRYVNDPIRSEVAHQLALIIGNSDEKFVSSKIAVQRNEYVKLGLADAALLQVALSEVATILTVDLNLYLAALATGINVINYNHIREKRSDFQ